MSVTVYIFHERLSRRHYFYTHGSMQRTVVPVSMGSVLMDSSKIEILAKLKTKTGPVQLFTKHIHTHTHTLYYV